ncbi:thymidine kinase [Compostibacter hankyongensis]|uniref:Thymidine kinase n=1 Tax=Compostibacter hankyongensis TaxID=1007089 RepID=A0ABP8FHK1_9BACT
MFIEPSFSGTRYGWIEVICGSMFSGKTEELMRRLRRARIANLKVKVFKPALDTRYDEQQIVSHDEHMIRSIPLEHSRQILPLAEGMEVVGIDEAQFLDQELPAVCDELAGRGIRVVVAGLDMDFEGRPFGPVPFLLAKADFVTKLHAICMQCGDMATYSYRKSGDKSTLLLGEKDLYEPRCRRCYLLGQ